MQHNTSDKNEGLEILLKNIKETEVRKREECLLKKNYLFVKCTGHVQSPVYSRLLDLHKGILRRRCLEKLYIPKVPTISDFFRCAGSSVISARIPTASFLDLILFLKRNGVKEPSIFRKEGERGKYTEIMLKLSKNERIEYKRYTIIELASGLKSYIRDYLNGYFDKKLLIKIFASIKENDLDKAVKQCKYLIFSMNKMRRSCFLNLQELFLMIDKNSDKTKMSLQSLCNIFCMTFTPNEMFENVDEIGISVQFFSILINLDLEDLSDVRDLI